MSNNEDLEKRIEHLEKEVKHLKAVLQYQMRNKKKWNSYLSFICLIVFFKIMRRQLSNV